ncbi:tis11 zinc finger protein isoform 2-T3 [Cochliomyia hominivorax]
MKKRLNNKVTENLHQNTNTLSNGHINIGTSMTELSLMDINCSNNSSMDQMDKMDQMEQIQQQQQQQQQQNQNKTTLNHQFRFHAALTRTISTPQPQLKQHHLNQIHSHQQQQLQQQQQQQQQQSQPQQDSNVATLVNTLIENLGNINLHRKLERTQSEPLPQQQVNTSRYKTELCRPFEEAGECKYGEKCQFAHGYHELRNLQRHPKYKTEFCRTFHSVGFCPYGPRCHFVHNADEARALQQQQQQQQQQQLQQQTKLQQQNHSNYYPLSAKSSLNGVGGSGGAINHSLPLSPPLSMSTGSDRESPTGSLSLSPTSSMTNFPFGEQISPSNSVFQNAFTYVNTPPESPNAPMSPVNTPPPTLMLGQTPVYIKPVVANNVGSVAPTTTQQPPAKQLLQKSSSSPIAVIRGSNATTNTVTTTTNTTKPPIKMNSVSSLNGAMTAEEARLPVFNRISNNSTADAFSHVAL